ncbi:ketoacyl-ACP synthase III [Achromobacter aegrifaciens]|uniref:ketoacyl-ACP synthase III n=1 Tax=Achromobacter aegrifaciens TaxID=1287736 RepID=UPI0014688048|nr:ketoacyl-ACP synthase III [Achromobacter aegrifaciens]CAB3664921.1 3-oxoacyl-[acyl-carrier-protein] synthase 3 [Achromobacter aegrifaciens]
MIGISRIATFIPSDRIDNLARAESLGSTPEQVSERIGFTQVARMAERHGALDMATEALSRLLHDGGIAPQEIDALVVVTQNPDRNIPHLSAELHGKAGLATHCACFDLGLGCSGYVYGLSVLASFMQANGLRRGVLVTADPYSGIVDPEDKATALIFGDAATATLLEEDARYSLGRFTFGTQGSEADKLACNDGVLFMNGRAVFNFAAQQVPANIRETVTLNGLTLDDIDRYVLHQGSRYIVQTIADRLKVSRDKAPFMSAAYGNTVSSSIPLMLSELLQDPASKRMLLCGFGLGLSWASTVIQRKE